MNRLQLFNVFAILLSLVAVTVTGCPQEKELPKLQGVVNDYANVIDDKTEKQIVALLQAQEKETTNQVVILTVDSMHGKTVEEYAVDVFAKWQLGDKEKDNGVLIVHSTGDRKMRIEVGLGLEGTLTDMLCGRIIDDQMTPLFKAGKFSEGHRIAATSVVQILNGEFDENVAINKVAAANQMSPGAKVMLTIVLIIFVLLVLLFLFGVATGRITASDLSSGSSGGGTWGGGGGGGGYFGGGGSSGGGGASGGY